MALVSGRKTVTTAGTRVALTPSAAGKKVIVTALEGNIGVVVIGGVDVVAALATRKGIPLAAGAPFAVDLLDASLVYVDSVISGDGVSFVVIS